MGGSFPWESSLRITRLAMNQFGPLLGLRGTIRRHESFDSRKLEYQSCNIRGDYWIVYSPPPPCSSCLARVWKNLLMVTWGDFPRLSFRGTHWEAGGTSALLVSLWDCSSIDLASKMCERRSRRSKTKTLCKTTMNLDEVIISPGRPSEVGRHIFVCFVSFHRNSSEYVFGRNEPFALLVFELGPKLES